MSDKCCFNCEHYDSNTGCPYATNETCVDMSKWEPIFTTTRASNEFSVNPAYEVVPETVSQYTGLKDKNGINKKPRDIISDLKAQNALYREALEGEALVNRLVVVCCQHYLAEHGSDESKKLFTSIGYGKGSAGYCENITHADSCLYILKMIAETGNKNAQNGKPDFYDHPALVKNKIK